MGMKHKPHADGWQLLLARVSKAIDLEASCRASGALVRKRHIQDASTLLRLALAYGPGGLSLRETACWACAQKIADISDVGLMYRLRDAADWLGEIAGRLLARRSRCGTALGRRLRMMDATVISTQGTALNWRLHATYDVDGQRFSEFGLTDIHGAEKLERAPVVADEIRVADRCYARPDGIAHILDGHGDFVLRVGSRSLRLTKPDGSPFNLSAALERSTRSGGQDQRVLVQHGNNRRWKPRPVRLLILPKPPDVARRSRQMSRNESRRGQHRHDPLAAAAAGHLILITSLPKNEYPAAEVAEIYRMRWQIELAFKRLKSLLRVDTMLAKDTNLVRAWIFAHLIVALIIEDIAPQVGDSPPWAPRIKRSRALHLADHKNTAG
ncbi:MAG: IS4 family transposase [Rhodospirillaceae bacterium]|nr:IS4 family transposase [Rhodospirillaceae bacterium]